MSFLKDILTYPIRGNNKDFFIILFFLSIISKVASVAPFIGLIADFIFIGYSCCIFFNLVEISTYEGNQTPEFPDILNFFEDIIQPFFRVIFSAIISFLPLILYIFFNFSEKINFYNFVATILIIFEVISFTNISFLHIFFCLTEETNIIFITVSIIFFYGGLTYFLMSVLSIATLQYTLALSPNIIIPAILRAGWKYWLGTFIIILLLTLIIIVTHLLRNHFIINNLFLSIIYSFFLIATARFIGLIYRNTPLNC